MPEDLKFFASNVVLQEDDGIVIIGFADNAASQRYLTLQRSLMHTAQDVRLGHDRIHFERDDQLHSGYGGIIRGTLSRSGLLLELTEETARDLGVRRIVEISFQIHDDLY